jgi:hypothetical protein
VEGRRESSIAMIEAENHLDRDIREVAKDIEQMLGKEGYKRTFQAFWKKYINLNIIDISEKIPEMILLLRETKEPYLFAMIICFLNYDYTLAHLPLKYALHEWQPHEEEVDIEDRIGT